jgi:hypothetical protein
MNNICFALFSLVLLAVTHCEFVFAAEGPLQMSSPQTGWVVHYTGTNELDFYSVTTEKGGGGLLMFSKWPPATKPEEITATMRKMADTFVKNAKKSADLKLIDEKYELEPFAGDHCKGTYARFRFMAGENESVQTMFMMSIDGQIWNGQFTGKQTDWTEALKLLKTIRIK